LLRSFYVYLKVDIIFSEENLSSITQIAKQVNSTGVIYSNDIKDTQTSIKRNMVYTFFADEKDKVNIKFYESLSRVGAMKKSNQLSFL
jgi:hypothetical protein